MTGLSRLRLRFYYSYNKNQQDALPLKSILVKNSTYFGQIHCPSSEFQHCIHCKGYVSSSLCWLSASVVRMEQCCVWCWNFWWRTVDLSKTCTVLYQTRFEKQCILLASIIGIYHDAQSSVKLRLYLQIDEELFLPHPYSLNMHQFLTLCKLWTWLSIIT